MTHDMLLSRIEAFAGRHGLRPKTVTKRAVDNSRLYDTLRSGGSCTVRVASKLEAFMDEEDAKTEGHTSQGVHASASPQAPLTEQEESFSSPSQVLEPSNAGAHAPASVEDAA